MLLSISLLAYPDPKELRKRRVYEIVSDRFAGTSQSKCESSEEKKQYCGGDFKGITTHLDYIKNLGYNAISLSPTIQQVDSNYSFRGYWPADFYSTNPHFGTDQDLKDLVKAAHSMDILVLAHVQFNSVGLCDENIPDDFSCIKTFPHAEYYHENYDCYEHERNLCRMNGLPDLNQSHPFVRAELLNWSKYYQQEFNFDGFRFSGYYDLDESFLKELGKETPWFVIADVDNWDHWQKEREGQFSNVYNYYLHTTLKLVFSENQNSMTLLSQPFSAATEELGDDANGLGIYLDNAETERILQNINGDKALFKNLIILLHTWIGIPFLTYGTELEIGLDSIFQLEPLWNKNPEYIQTSEYYQLIKKLNELRDKTKIHQLDQRELESSDLYYTYARGNQILVALTNVGNTDSNINIKIQNSPFEKNTRICDLLSDLCINVNNDESVDMNLIDGQPRVFVRYDMI
ncbi:1 [Hexamita inflata]|uniref:alpha-amylase n=1 Tax=Hexamita inflata TaxID=28002 RepID=A0AA86THT9_9EUKA|nr:1 [Hexamita inflata] [Hexamita inflata]